MIGNGRSRAALLLELSDEHGFGADPVVRIWPIVEAASNDVPAHGRVSRSMIIIVSPDKPFARASKGTIIRRLTEMLYSDEVQKIYKGKNF